MPRLLLIALLAGAFTLATLLEPGLRDWSGRKSQSQSLITALMGDSRRLFANQFFIQSDVYLHAGSYPSIFDRNEVPPAHGEAAPGEAEPAHQHSSGFKDDPAEELSLRSKPRNWIDAFGRNFFPHEHRHPGEGGTKAIEAREILPWLKLSAEMDPQRVETYTVAAFWLRQMNKNDEALLFLREGLRANPVSYEILFELGSCYEERKEFSRARNLWELALRRWQEQQAGKEEPDRLMVAQILTQLARLESREGRRDQVLSYLERLKSYSPVPHEVENRIKEVKAGLPFAAESKSPPEHAHKEPLK